MSFFRIGTIAAKLRVVGVCRHGAGKSPRDLIVVLSGEFPIAPTSLLVTDTRTISYAITTITGRSVRSPRNRCLPGTDIAIYHLVWAYLAWRKDIALSQKILAVDDEPDILRLTQFLLESWGYEVSTAASGREAVERAQTEEPDLILMDVNMEEMNGFEACEKIKNDFATSFIPVIMLTSQDQVQNKVHGLGKGADDYVIKTVDPLELQARIEMVIRRTQEQSGANPLTRLPGNLVLEREIKKRLDSGEPFSVCYCDLDNFKAYNDKYGYEAGDRVIFHTAQTIMNSVRALGDNGDFVGHIGGDDFVVVTTPVRDKLTCKAIAETFDGSIVKFYHAEDLERGSIQIENRSGTLERFPIMSITMAIVSGVKGDFPSTHVIAERAAELKKYLKKYAGSNYLSERRGIREQNVNAVTVTQGMGSAR